MADIELRRLGAIYVITPEDIRSKLFTTVRLRQGYDPREVDEFLDEVHAALNQMTQERDDLTREVARLRNG